MDYSKELVNYHNEVIDTIDAIMRKTNCKITYEELKSLKIFLGAYFEVHYLCKFMKVDSNENQDTLKDVCKAWDEAIDKKGYIN